MSRTILSRSAVSPFGKTAGGTAPTALGSTSMSTEGPEDDSSGAECPTCGKVYKNESGLKTHYGHAHDGELFSDDSLIRELQAIAGSLGRTPTSDEVDEIARHPSDFYASRFGGWNEAIQAAGLETTQQLGISKEDLLNELRRLDSRLPRSPKRADMIEKGEYGKDPYVRQFGSWSGALCEARIDPCQMPASEINREELIEEVNRLAKELGRTPRSEDMAELGRYSPRPYDAKFGCWNAAVRQAGHVPTGKWRVSEDELRDEIHRLHEVTDRIPTLEDLEQQGEYGPKPYYRVFGSWTSALRDCGMTPFCDRERERVRYDYGPNWQEQREKRLEKDSYECQACTLSQKKHIEQYGKGLHIHHITPFKKFGAEGERDYKRANRVSNLVTLCLPCHVEWEDIGLRPQMIN